MNETIRNQLNHRTFREFTNQRIDERVVETLLEVANHTASSVGLQSFSIIRVKDPNKKQLISEVCNQEYAGRVPELFIFIVDNYRNSKILESIGGSVENIPNMDKFFQGFTDAALAAQNVTNAIESLGMGTVYFGSILNNPLKIVEILNLPKLTFPVLGLGFGYSDQNPLHKPRIAVDLKVFEDEYKILDNYDDNFCEYNDKMLGYYDMRDPEKKCSTFTEILSKVYSTQNPLRADILNAIRVQGYSLFVE